MITCIDLDGTISADPAFYRAEMRGLMEYHHEVHVLTGNPDAAKVLTDLELQKGRDYTRVAVIPKKHIAETKVAYMKRVGATHLIDNVKANVRAARKAGFTGHWHASPKGDL